ADAVAGWLDRLDQGQWQRAALKFGPHDLQSVVDETETVLEAGDHHAFDAGKRRGAPLSAVGAAVVAYRRQAANVTFAAVVIRGHARVVKESEQFVAMLEQASPDTQAFGMAGALAQEQLIETVDDLAVGLGEGFAAQLRTILAQLDGVLKQGEQRLDERPHRWAGQFCAQLGQFTQQVGQTALLGTVQAVVSRVEIAD